MCCYEMHIRGHRQAVFAFYATVASVFSRAILRETVTDNGFVLCVGGTAFNQYKIFGRERKAKSLDANRFTEEQIRNGETDLDSSNLSIRQRAEMFGLDVIVRTWSKEENYDQMEVYKRGYFVGIVGDLYRPDNDFEFDF